MRPLQQGFIVSLFLKLIFAALGQRLQAFGHSEKIQGVMEPMVRRKLSQICRELAASRRCLRMAVLGLGRVKTRAG
jgi:hypothetical protein